QVRNAASVADQSAGLDERAKLVDRGHRVAEREHRELFAPAVEEWIARDHEPAGLQSDQICEGRINVASATRVQDMELPPQCAGRLLQLSRLDIATGKSRVDERGYCAPVGEQLVQQLQSLPIRFRTQRGHACEVTARSVQAGYETDLNRIGAGHKNNGDRGGFSLGRYRRLAVRDNHAHLTTNQIGCQCRQSIAVPFRPAVFDRHVAALDIAGFRQALAKRGQELGILTRRPGVEKPKPGHPRLLRAGCARPRDRRAAEQCDELAPLHSITSSAITDTPAGTSRPSALAVLRLITSSYL